MNQELLSQEHMLSQQEVSELETGICHTLVEEMHGTYGLQVIRKAYQNMSAWGNDIEMYIHSSLLKTSKREGTLVLHNHSECLLS